MPIAAETIKDSVVQCISYAQLHELLLTVVLTAVAAAVTAWWTSSASTPKWKSIPKVDASPDVQITEIAEEKTPETADAKIAQTVCADSADPKTPLRDADADCQSEASQADVEIAQVDLSHCPSKEDDDHDDDSDVDIDSWRAVAGRFASVLSLADDDEDQLNEYAGSMLWSAHHASAVKCGLPGIEVGAH
mmetsp:Transcript_24280/g.46130  ORF Transcript_24280/g.46130 Transcript_24280/m.46130 type:complete len:191 (-) Transcript_24280:181-753(-)